MIVSCPRCPWIFSLRIAEKKPGLSAGLDLSPSEEFHVGFSVCILDEPVSLPSHVSEEENWKLIAVCTPLRPGHAMQERVRELVSEWDMLLEVDKRHQSVVQSPQKRRLGSEILTGRRYPMRLCP